MFQPTPGSVSGREREVSHAGTDRSSRRGRQGHFIYPAGTRRVRPADRVPRGSGRPGAAPGPSENDQVIEAAGAHVYLEPQAAVYLEDKVLDAEVDSEGKAHFSLGMQGTDQA